jgi:hypothetical protein
VHAYVEGHDIRQRIDVVAIELLEFDAGKGIYDSQNCSLFKQLNSCVSSFTTLEKPFRTVLFVSALIKEKGNM